MPRIKITTIESDGSKKTAIVDTAFGLEFAKAKYAAEHSSVIAIDAEFADPHRYGLAMTEVEASKFLHELAGAQYLMTPHR